MNYYLGYNYVPDGTKPVQLKLRVPIEWVPLAVEGDKTLLITKNCIDSVFYDFNPEQCCIWKESDLKETMDELYEEYFSEEEKAVIIEQPMGKLFILSKNEIEKYLPTAESRRAVMYSIFKKDGKQELAIEHSSYWLRKDNMDDDPDDLEVPYVDELGKINYCGVDSDEIGIRAAMYVDTQKARMLSAKAGYNSRHHYWGLEEY